MENLLERLMGVFEELQPDLEEALEAMAIIQARIATDIGWEYELIAMVADQLEITRGTDAREGRVLQ